MARIIKVKIEPGVTKTVAKVATKICTSISELIPIEHNILTRIINAENFPNEKGELVDGWILHWPETEYYIIFVKGILDKKKPKHEALEEFKVTLLHEIVHYEQLRDGNKDFFENGVDIRAKSLLRKLEN